MEKKTKQRILGALVLIGVIIILLPLFQGGKELPSETTLIKAPPFPDQAVQVTSTQDQVSPAPVSQAIAQDQSMKPQTTNTLVPDDTIANPPTQTNTQPPSIIQPTETPVATPPPSPATSLDPNAQNTIQQNNIEKVDIDTTDDDFISSNTETKLDQKPTKTASVKKIVHPKPARSYDTYKIKSVSIKATDKNGLANLTGPVWVIQIGSFKNKANALRLVNQLRLNGYNAFIQQVSTTFGNSTRVFVGPETHQASARALAKQLASEMRIRGIVISYKPLAL